MSAERLKAPFPAFGGKSAVAALIWERLGNVDNFVEPFFNSGAVLLGRPHAPRVETANDINHYVANFWRATQRDPEAVVAHCDWPVNESDLHARHRWLVLSKEAAAFRGRMATDPEYFDARIAGWWVWGVCCWIGGGWCAPSGGQGPPGGSGNRHPSLSAGDGAGGQGVHAANAEGLKRPALVGDCGGSPGIHGRPTAKRPLIGGDNPASYGKGVHAGRPQLGDAYDIGRGVNASPPDGPEGVCERRRAWLLDWFGRLRDRLRNVRVCCGDWSRVCSSESVLVRLGTTGVFLDPPYPRRRKDGSHSRAGNLYATDADKGKTPEQIRDEILEWAGKWGEHRLMRFCIAGYEGDGYEALAGWSVESWKAGGGYGNRSDRGKKNAKRERLWFSPHCQRPRQRGLFDGLDAA